MTQRIKTGFLAFETHAVYQYLPLALITLVAAALRFYKLGEWSFWIDEIFTIGRVQAHYGSLEAIIHNIPPNWSWMPLSLIATAGVLNVLGISEWSARLVPALIGIISIPVLYFPVKRLFGPGVGLLTVLLLAVSPWHLYWSQNARFYTSLMLLYSLALFAFFYGIERDRPGYILAFIVLVYLATSERLFALFIVPVVAFYVLALKVSPLEKPPGLRARNLILMILPGIAGGIVEIHSLLSTGSSRFFGDWDWFFLYRGEGLLRFLVLIVFSVGIPLMCLGIFGGIHLLLRKSRAGLLFLIGALVPVVLLVLANPFIFTEDRYVFVALPSWIILGALAVEGISAQGKNHGKLLAAGVLVLLLADGMGDNLMYYNANNGNRHDWKGAFALIQERSRDGDVFVATWDQLGTYYLGQEVMPWADLDLDTVVQTDARFWFVTDEDAVWLNWEMKQWVEEKAELIDVRYLRTADNLNLRIYLYDPALNDGLSR
jgi:4-amino-4-deoxy-L-arabinose transferase-like glycosyltransferase